MERALPMGLFRKDKNAVPVADAAPAVASAYALPVATIASGLSFAAVDPGHHWWRDGIAGLAWGTAAAVIGWRRWRQRSGETKIP
jgi:hypothetical protein